MIDFSLKVVISFLDKKSFVLDTLVSTDRFHLKYLKSVLES